MSDSSNYIPRHIALKIKTGWVLGSLILCFKGLYLLAAIITSTQYNNSYYLLHVFDFVFFASIVICIYFRLWLAAIIGFIYIILTVISFINVTQIVYLPIIDIITALLFIQSAWGIWQYKLFLKNPNKEEIINKSKEKEKYQETQYEEIEDLEEDYWMTEKQKEKKRNSTD